MLRDGFSLPGEVYLHQGQVSQVSGEFSGICSFAAFQLYFTSFCLDFSVINTPAVDIRHIPVVTDIYRIRLMFVRKIKDIKYSILLK